MKAVNIAILTLIALAVAGIVYLLWHRSTKGTSGTGTKPYVIGEEKIDYTIDPNKIHIPPTL